MKAEQLRKSILQLAIQGKLVPQDPSDEPASVLLERIRAEKQCLINEGKIKKDKGDSVIFKGDDNCYYEKTGSEVKNITDEIPFDIPSTWCWVRLGNVLEIARGGSPRPIKEYLTTDNTGVNWIKIGDTEKGGKYINSTKEKIKQSGISKSRFVHKGDFLLTNSMSFGRPYILNIDGCIHDGWLVFSDTSNVYFKDFLYYVLSSSFANKQFVGKVSGAVVKNLNSDKVADSLFPLPPIAEQKRIVAEIEKFEPLIAEYDKLEQQATKLDGEIYDKLKKSILQYAIQGKLVQQDSNDEPASVLLECIRTEKKAQLGKKYVESYISKGDDNCYYGHINGTDVDITEEIPFDLPDSWAWSRWGELSDSIQYGYNAPAKQSGRIKMVRISDIHENQVMWENVPYCDIAEEDISTYLLKENDILFARTGGTVGKSFLVQNIKEEAIYAGYLIRTRYNSKLIPQYFKYFMESPLYWSQLRNGTIATAQPNCNGQTLSKMIVPVPPLNEQNRIVEKIDEIFAKL